MAGHAQLKFVMTECSNTQIRVMWLIKSCNVIHEISFRSETHALLKTLHILHMAAPHRPAIFTGPGVCETATVMILSVRTAWSGQTV